MSFNRVIYAKYLIKLGYHNFIFYCNFLIFSIFSIINDLISIRSKDFFFSKDDKKEKKSSERRGW